VGYYASLHDAQRKKQLQGEKINDIVICFVVKELQPVKAI
jgi:hypothetical protein